MAAITKQTRAESSDLVDRALRYRQIKQLLGREPDLTAREVATKMFLAGMVPAIDRNFAAPRLTELVRDGQIVVSGKKYDEVSGRTVAAYRMKEVMA